MTKERREFLLAKKSAAFIAIGVGAAVVAKEFLKRRKQYELKQRGQDFITPEKPSFLETGPIPQLLDETEVLSEVIELGPAKGQPEIEQNSQEGDKNQSPVENTANILEKDVAQEFTLPKPPIVHSEVLSVIRSQKYADSEELPEPGRGAFEFIRDVEGVNREDKMAVWQAVRERFEEILDNYLKDLDDAIVEKLEISELGDGALESPFVEDKFSPQSMLAVIGEVITNKDNNFSGEEQKHEAEVDLERWLAGPIEQLELAHKRNLGMSLLSDYLEKLGFGRVEAIPDTGRFLIAQKVLGQVDDDRENLKEYLEKNNGDVVARDTDSVIRELRKKLEDTSEKRIKNLSELREIEVLIDSLAADPMDELTRVSGRIREAGKHVASEKLNAYSDEHTSSESIDASSKNHRTKRQAPQKEELKVNSHNSVRKERNKNTSRKKIALYAAGGAVLVGAVGLSFWAGNECGDDNGRNFPRSSVTRTVDLTQAPSPSATIPLPEYTISFTGDLSQQDAKDMLDLADGDDDEKITFRDISQLEGFDDSIRDVFVPFGSTAHDLNSWQTYILSEDFLKNDSNESPNIISFSTENGDFGGDALTFILRHSNRELPNVAKDDALNKGLKKDTTIGLVKNYVDFDKKEQSTSEKEDDRLDIWRAVVLLERHRKDTKINFISYALNTDILSLVEDEEEIV